MTSNRDQTNSVIDDIVSKYDDFNDKRDTKVYLTYAPSNISSQKLYDIAPGFTDNAFKSRRGFRNNVRNISFKLHPLNFLIGGDDNIGNDDGSMRGSSIYDICLGITLTIHDGDKVYTFTYPCHYLIEKDSKWCDKYYNQIMKPHYKNLYGKYRDTKNYPYFG